VCSKIAMPGLLEYARKFMAMTFLSCGWKLGFGNLGVGRLGTWVGWSIFDQCAGSWR